MPAEWKPDWKKGFCNAKSGLFVEISLPGRRLRWHCELGDDYEAHANCYPRWRQAEEDLAAKEADGFDSAVSRLIHIDNEDVFTRVCVLYSTGRVNRCAAEYSRLGVSR